MSRSGFFAIIGRPHVGKSAFIDYLVNHKMAVTPKGQKVGRNFVKAIIGKNKTQIVLVDVLPFVKPKDEESRDLNKRILEDLEAVDVIVLMVDASQIIGAEDCYIVEQIQDIKKPKILVLNKADLVKNDELKIQTEVACYLEGFELILPISSVEGKGINNLLDKIISYLKEGEADFSESKGH